MDRHALLQSLDELFELDPGSVREDSVIADIPGWDSLTFVGLIALVDEEYGVTLSPSVVLGAGCVSDLMDHIASQVATRSAA
ncbi:acyl carrier protein [Pirellulales bacterium]|nr:acyl carrier protein [Pirellulales bacterium]